MHWNHCEQLLHHSKIVINSTDICVIVCVIVKSDWVRTEMFVDVTWHVRNVLCHCVDRKADAAKLTCAFFFVFRLAAVVGGVAPLTRNHGPVSFQIQEQYLTPPVCLLTPFSAIWKHCWSTIPVACFFASLYGYILGFSFWSFALGILFYLPEPRSWPFFSRKTLLAACNMDCLLKLLSLNDFSAVAIFSLAI